MQRLMLLLLRLLLLRWLLLLLLLVIRFLVVYIGSESDEKTHLRFSIILSQAVCVCVCMGVFGVCVMV